jgi:hypothetical protein
MEVFEKPREVWREQVGKRAESDPVGVVMGEKSAIRFVVA